MNAETPSPALRMLGPALMLAGTMLPWGAGPAARGLDGWGVLVLMVSVPALWLPWAIRGSPRARPILGALAFLAAVGALGAWLSAWQTAAAEAADPAREIGKGPLFTLVGAVLTGAALPNAWKPWQRALATAGGVGLAMALAFGLPAVRFGGRGLATAGQGPSPALRTPWVVIEIQRSTPSSETPSIPPGTPKSEPQRSPTPAPPSRSGSPTEGLGEASQPPAPPTEEPPPPSVPTSTPMLSPPPTPPLSPLFP
jgi:hypothetical protein